MKPLALIVARAKNGIIGLNGKLPWNYPEDMRSFQRLTMGHHIIVGRKTWERMPSGLPGRVKFVISGHEHTMPQIPQLRWYDNLDFAITKAQEVDPLPFVIGGQSIYQQAMHRVTRIYLTTIDKTYHGDRWFDAPLDEFARVEFHYMGDLLFETLERRQ